MDIFLLPFICEYIRLSQPNNSSVSCRPYDTKLKMRGLKFKRASVSELKTELEAWGVHEKFSVEKASRLA